MSEHKCPSCGSTRIVKIVYGMPTEETFKAAERGEIILGGCCLRGNDPTCQCIECNKRF